VTRLAHVGLLVVIGWLAAACQQPVESRTAERPSDQVPAVEVNPGDQWPVLLEFDLPAESGVPSRSGVITAYRLGYFRVGEMRPLQSIELPAEALTLRGRTATVRVPKPEVPDGVDRVVIRLQSLSSAGSSVWSAPTPPVVVPPSDGTPSQVRDRPTAEQIPARRRTDGLLPVDVEPYGALAQAVRELLEPDDPLEALVKRFTRVDDLALAVAVSRSTDVSLKELSEAMEGPPRRPLGRALRQLRPALQAGTVVREARPEARRMLDTAGPDGR